MTRPEHQTQQSGVGRVILFVLLAGLALLAAGALAQRQAFLTRGIPPQLPHPIENAGVELGVNVYLEQYDDVALQETLAAIAESGIDVVKQTFHFSAETPFNWSQSDRLITAISDAGLDPVVLLDGDPANSFAPPDDPAQFAAWAGAFARRYGDLVDFYIIWDEPNLAAHWGNVPVNPDEYAALLSATAQAIDSADATASIVAAPLAPTSETDSVNLADPLYLQALYEAGASDAFDIVAAKPYGFDSSPADRGVDIDTLNFSRAILLREVMTRNGDAGTALWAGNWGWNALPTDWQGNPSIWGSVSEAEQTDYTLQALNRARREWPWMGVMFLENWEPDAPPDDPRWGFSVANRPILDALQVAQPSPNVAYPGFHLATENDLAQSYSGDWRFSAEYGADSSEKTGDQPRDTVEFRFWGTDLGLRVRRADFRARYYVTIDGEPANALPLDENGSAYGGALVLDAPDPAEDYIAIEPVATDLEPGEHVAVIVAERGWGQWALNGFSVGYTPSNTAVQIAIALLVIVALICIVLAIRAARHVNGGATGQRIHNRYTRLTDRTQLLLIASVAAIAGVTGWLTWGQQAAGAYRRLGDGSQLALIAGTAAAFYVTPWFIVYAIALVVLIVLLSFRPAWGLALIAIAMPFYAVDVLKPVFNYRFSAVEIFTWVALAGFLLYQTTLLIMRYRANRSDFQVGWRGRFVSADYAVLAFTFVATASLFFTERLDPALREWRTLIIGAALFYALLRWIKPAKREMWVVIDAWVLSAVVVAVVGLAEYLIGSDRIVAEGGLFRLRSVYGSPNNVALYFGRILPLLLAIALLGKAIDPLRRRLYMLALLPTGLAMLLTFSKGGLLLAVPIGLIIVFIYWQRFNRRRVWPWLIAFGVIGFLLFTALLRVPALADRLDLLGETSFLRVNLWRASLYMFADNFWTGVGLDNFLTAYRGRYIFAEAWREPNLNHPHNLLLDFGTRLGIFGLITGLWMLIELGKRLLSLPQRVMPEWRAVAVGLVAGFCAMVVHGLVDHSFFLIDLAYVFMLMLGVTVWLQMRAIPGEVDE
jgi:O-antigen ligase